MPLPPLFEGIQKIQGARPIVVRNNFQDIIRIKIRHLKGENK